MAGARLADALAHYRQLAPRYDARTRRIDAIRREAIAALDLRPGEVVLDAGCGTGWCIPALAERVGPRGAVIAFDPSPDMLAIARKRSAAAPVTLLHAEARAIRLPRAPDAVLFSYTHDLIRSPEALEHLLAQAREGARVAATSTKLYARWLWPANAYLRWSHRGYITDFEGLDAPWSLLAARLDGFAVRTHGLTQHYIATGRVPARRQAA